MGGMEQSDVGLSDQRSTIRCGLSPLLQDEDTCLRCVEESQLSARQRSPYSVFHQEIEGILVWMLLTVLAADGKISRETHR